MVRTSIEKIEKAVFEAMSKKVGTSDLYWVKCLFDHQLAGGLEVKEGVLECQQPNQESWPVNDALQKIGFYDRTGHDPLAQLFSPVLPEGYSLFLIGPESYKKSPLALICANPKLDSRDQEEHTVLCTLDKKIEELVVGKHKNVRGELIVPREEDWHRIARVMKKSFGPIVEPSADFYKDIEDLIVCARVYSKFELYQLKRDETSREIARKIIADSLVI